jgi:hypothetical protein
MVGDGASHSNVEPNEFLKCFAVVKSLLANMVGDWNVVTNTGGDMAHLPITIELLKALEKAQWLPSPLKHCHDILPLLPSKQGGLVLLQVWRFICENPPTVRDSLVRSFDPTQYQDVLRTIKRVLQANMDKVVPFFASFYVPSEATGEKASLMETEA